MKHKGFTLIELIVVIGIIAILAAIVVIAINPAKQFSQSRNTQRRSDLKAIYNGLNQYFAENNGQISADITTTPKVIGTSADIDLTARLVPTYMTAVPKDPSGGTDANTRYLVFRDSANRLTLSASGAELSQSISIGGDTSALDAPPNYTVNIPSATLAHLSIPDSASVRLGSSMSIEFWLYKLTSAAYGMHVTKNYGNASLGSGWYQIMNDATGGKLVGRITADSDTITTTATIPANTWTHVVLTYDGATARFYINGNLDSSVAVTATPSHSSAPLYIGRRSDGYYSNSRYDEMRLYSRTLTGSEVTTHYNNGTRQYGSIESGLSAGWHFDEATGTTAADYSGNGNTATLINGVTWVARP